MVVESVDDKVKKKKGRFNGAGGGANVPTNMKVSLLVYSHMCVFLCFNVSLRH